MILLLAFFVSFFRFEEQSPLQYVKHKHQLVVFDIYIQGYEGYNDKVPVSCSFCPLYESYYRKLCDNITRGFQVTNVQ